MEHRLQVAGGRPVIRPGRRGVRGGQPRRLPRASPVRTAQISAVSHAGLRARNQRVDVGGLAHADGDRAAHRSWSVKA